MVILQQFILVQVTDVSTESLPQSQTENKGINRKFKYSSHRGVTVSHCMREMCHNNTNELSHYKYRPKGGVRDEVRGLSN